MIVNFGFNKSTKTKVDKVIEWPTDGQHEGTLVDSCDVVNPVILLKTKSSTGIFHAVNYFYIPIFNRYYFITGIKAIRTGVVEVSGHCDVLTSAAPQIKEHYCIVDSSQKGFNKYLNDGSFKIYQNRVVINKFKFPNEFDTGSFVLALAGS